MKNITLTTLFVVAIAAIIASQFYLHHEQKTQTAFLTALQLESRHTGRIRLDELQHKINTIQTSLGLIQSDYTSARQAQFRELGARIDDVLETQNDENLQALRKQIDDIVKGGALIRDHSLLAEEAFGLAEDAKERGDHRLAAIYFLSAINHAPSETRYLEAYSEMISSSPDSGLEDMSRLRSVLQMSMYQIPPSEIGLLINLLGEVEKTESDLLSQEVPAPKPIDWRDEFHSLAVDDTLQSSWGDPETLKSLAGDLADIVDALHLEQPDSPLLFEAESALKGTRQVLSASLLTATIDKLVVGLEGSLNQAEKASSLLQSIEINLSQLWAVDSATLPDNLRAKIDDYPGDLRSLAEAVAKARSEVAIAAIDEQLRQALLIEKNGRNKSRAMKYQKSINGIDARTTTIIRLSSKVYSEAGREKVDSAFKKLQRIQSEFYRDQLNAYQGWTINLVNGAFLNWNGEIMVSDEEAMQIMTKYKLASIDQSLLTPETGNAFRNVMSKLLNSVSGKIAFEIQKDIAEKPKKPLTDF
jgi:hypothetical protein